MKTIGLHNKYKVERVDGKPAPEMTLKIKGFSTGTGNPEWGAEPGKFYFVIKLGGEEEL